MEILNKQGAVGKEELERRESTQTEPTADPVVVEVRAPAILKQNGPEGGKAVQPLQPVRNGPHVIHTEDDCTNGHNGHNGHSNLTSPGVKNDTRHILFDMPQKNSPYGGDSDSDSSSSSSSGASAAAPAPRPVHERPDFKYLIMLGSFLTCNAGFLNAVAIILGRRPVAHVSGNTAHMSRYFARGNFADSGYYAMIILGFLCGSITAGVSVGSEKFVLGHRYGYFLSTIGCIYLLGTLIWEIGDVDPLVTFVLWSFASGMQNGMYTSFSGAVIRTTHVTGTLTDIGLAVGNWLRYKVLRSESPPGNTWKLRVLIPLYVSFVMGSMFAAWTVDDWDFRAAYVPSGTLIVLGMVYRLLAAMGMYDGFLEEEKVEEEIEAIEQKFSAALHSALAQHGASPETPAVGGMSHMGRISRNASQRMSRQLSVQSGALDALAAMERGKE